MQYDVQWSRKMFDIGGAEFFCDIIHVYICVHMPFFTYVKHNRNF